MKPAEKPKRVNSFAPAAATMAVSSVCPSDYKCARCGRVGSHFAKDCRLPMTREFTRAEMQEKRIAASTKKAEVTREITKARAERQEKRNAASKKKAEVQECDAKSDISFASTSVSTVCTLTPDQLSDVHSSVEKDKEVMKLAKKLREIAKLEQSTDLDALQQKKVDQKSEVELALETVRGLVASRARSEVRQQNALLGHMEC